METLKVLKAQERAEACWKSFKERTLTKRNARENLLLNSDFNNLLHLLLDANENERSVKVALDFVIKCIKSKIISPTAFMTLIQQKLPGNNTCKIDSMTVFNKLSSLILEIEKETTINFAVQLASNDLRMIPFLVEKTLSRPEVDIDSDFISFLLGDPDLVLTSSVFDDPHYKLSRCRILSHLVENVEKEKYSELLMTFLVWNSSRLCVMELGCLSKISHFFAKNQTYSTSHLELFEVYIEVLCNEFFKFGIFSEKIEFISKNCSKLINEYSAFMIGSLLLLGKDLDSSFVCSILQLLSHYDVLGNFSKICCAELMVKLSFTEELEILMRNIFKISINCCRYNEEFLNEPFTEFGMLSQLGLKGARPQSTSHEIYFDLVYLSKHLDQFSSFDLSEYLRKGHFEMIFSLLAYKWNSSDHEEVLKGFLELIGDIEEEDSESKILRYSWVVDFFESHLTDEMYLNHLPLICEFVTNTDNILFAFVQQKISTFLSQKQNICVQLPSLFSLFVLFESSQSRQSRLNFLTTMTLSYLHNIISQNLVEIDSRAVILAFKLMGKLAEITVVDPRDIWLKYAEKFIKSVFMSNSHIRASLFSFVSSLRIIPEGPEGEINEIKFAGIKFLLENLSIEADFLALDQICESLSKFDVEILRKVEIKLLQPEPIFDEEGNAKDVPIEDILSNSIIFNPLKLYEVSKRYNDPSQIYKNLWTKLIDHEVEVMPRTKFLGSAEKPNAISEVKTKFISNTSFCNGLIFESFTENEFVNIDDVLKCVKTRLIPLVPSINSLLWYIRPLLPGLLLGAVDKIIKKIDDQRIKQKLADYEYLISNLRTGTTPQSTSTLIMVISSIMKSAFINQIISENFLFSNWISILTKKLSDITEFKPLIANEEFLAAFAISCNILSGCSTNIDSALADVLDSMILNNSKIKDSVAIYCAIEALSNLNLEKVKIILFDKCISSKRKLVAGLSILRLGQTINEKLSLPEKPDDISLMLEIIATNGKLNCSKSTFMDPLEFKGLNLFVQSLISPQELKAKAEHRAFDSGSVPAALKYDSILSYLLGSGLNFITLTFENAENENLKSIEESTKDSKCLALLQMIKRSSSFGNTESSSSGLERFDKFSWLKFIGSIKSGIKYEILSNCKLLPRIEWSPVPIDNFIFILKHVFSITPITKVPYINPSLLSSFFEHALTVVKRDSIDLKKVIEVLYNNSDENSSKVLFEILNYMIEESKCDSLRFLIEESMKYPKNLLKQFEIGRFNSLEPEILSDLSSLLDSLLKHLSLDADNVAIVNFDAENSFNVIKNILAFSESNEVNILKLKVLMVKIRNLRGKAKIKVAIDVMDLMFIYQQDEEKFNLLSSLICGIFKDISLILLDSKIFINDTEIVNKIRSRASVIPKDIYDRLNSSFISSEYEKEAF